MHAQGKFIAFKKFFFSFRWRILWNSLPILLRAVFHFGTEIEDSENFEISRKFLGCKYSFFGCFCRVGQVSAGRLFSLCREWETSAVGNIEATRLGCEPGLRGRKFPDDSPRQLTGNPPRAAHHSRRSATKRSPLFTNKPHYWDTSFCSPTTHIFLKTIQLRPWSGVFLVTLIQGQEEVRMLYVYCFACVPYLPC